MNDINEINELVKKIDHHALPNLVSTLQKLDSGKHPEYCRCGYCDPDNEMSISAMRERSEFQPVDSNEQERIVLQPNSSIEEVKNIISRHEKKYAEEIAAGRVLEHDLLDVGDMKRIMDCWGKLMVENQQEAEEAALPKLKGILVFYIDVGNLPRTEAEAFLDRVKERFAPTKKRMPEEWEIMFMPVRGQSNSVEVIKF